MPHDPKPRVRVLIADDHPVFAQTLHMLLAADPRLEVAGVAENGADAVELARLLCPDVVLMDVHMPGMDGIDATRAIGAELTGVQVVMLSSSSAVEDVQQAREAGAAAYLTKDTSAAAITAEILRAAVPAPLSAAQAA